MRIWVSLPSSACSFFSCGGLSLKVLDPIEIHRLSGRKREHELGKPQASFRLRPRSERERENEMNDCRWGGGRVVVVMPVDRMELSSARHEAKNVNNFDDSVPPPPRYRHRQYCSNDVDVISCIQCEGTERQM
jgi:hypothetical protein